MEVEAFHEDPHLADTDRVHEDRDQQATLPVLKCKGEDLNTCLVTNVWWIYVQDIISSLAETGPKITRRFWRTMPCSSSMGICEYNFELSILSLRLELSTIEPDRELEII